VSPVSGHPAEKTREGKIKASFNAIRGKKLRNEAKFT
jgi:hypothetical protein